MLFGYTIVYVQDVLHTITFYEEAFGLERRFVHESLDYAELSTGTTTLAFASNDLGAMNFPGGYVPNELARQPAGIEIAFVTDNVQAAFDRAVQAGAEPLAQPTRKPWGQDVSYVRDVNGVLIELCSPMG